MSALEQPYPPGPRRPLGMKAPMELLCRTPQIPRGHHLKAAQGLCSNRGRTATEPLTSRRGARGPGAREGRAVWPERSPMARQRFCGARLLMERAPVFLNFGLGGKFPPITPQALKPFFFTPTPRGPGEEGLTQPGCHSSRSCTNRSRSMAQEFAPLADEA